MFSDVAAAAAQTLSPPFRAYLWKSIAATAALFVVCALLLGHTVLALAAGWPIWAGLAGSIVVGVLFLLGAAYLLAPITALIAGFYADRLAELTEADIGADRQGHPAALGPSIELGLRFTVLGIVLYALAFALWFTPGVNVVAFFVVNAYLFGRMTFEMVALRHGTAADGRALSRRHAGLIFVYGLWIALLLAIPVANLLTPLFSVALMARAYDRLANRP
jgi:CysZ protein